jgi:transposase
MATWAEMPRSPGHAFYDRLQDLLREASFDAFVEEVCKPYGSVANVAADGSVANWV